MYWRDLFWGSITYAIVVNNLATQGTGATATLCLLWIFGNIRAWKTDGWSLGGDEDGYQDVFWCTVKSLIWDAPNLKDSVIIVSSCSCRYPICWSQVLSREWRCSWSSADRRCSNYISVINNFITYWSAAYIRDLTVMMELMPRRSLMAGCKKKAITFLWIKSLLTENCSEDLTVTSEL